MAAAIERKARIESPMSTGASPVLSPVGGVGAPGAPHVDRANILIVDDRPDKLLVFRTILEELDQNIVTLQSGEEALRWLLDNECAVLLLDVNMPGMDGFERTRRSSSSPRTSTRCIRHAVTRSAQSTSCSRR